MKKTRLSSSRPLTLSASAGAIALVLAGLISGTAAADTPSTLDAPIGELTVMGTTDVHGHVYNWDYFTDAAPAAGKEWGLARVATIVEQVRADRGDDSVVLIDNGDSIQGTPLTYLAAMQPEVLDVGIHPQALAFNLLKYDAQTLGNHEFNYGLDTLNKYISELDAPMINANATKAVSGQPNYTPYVIVDKETTTGESVKVGILGLVTPGVRQWDKGHVEGKLDFRDTTSMAQYYVPQMKAAGADIIVVAAHTGLGDGGEWVPAALEENTSRWIASKVDGIDVILGGHSHQNKPSIVFHSPDGSPVLYTQPDSWAKRVSQVDLPLQVGAEGISVAWPADDAGVEALAQTIPVTGVAESPTYDNPVLQKAHQNTINYVNTVVATATEEMDTATSRYEDTPILDYIGQVQENTVRKALIGTKYEGIQVIAQVSPFSRTSKFPKGNVTIKDIAGLYVFDNTLMAVELSGAQVKDYLEFSARYFAQVEEGGTFDPETGTGTGPDGEYIPDYSYDALTGVHYEINISKPAGQRIENLRHANGTPLDDSERFILALNNYRQTGGSFYPHVTTAPKVYDELVEIRQALIDDAQARGVIDPKDFFVKNWKLVTKTEKLPVQKSDPTVSRISGDDRYDTSFIAAFKNMKAGEPLFVTTGAVYADALSVAPAAAKEGGNLILSRGTKVDEKVLNLIKERKPSAIYVVGGEKSLSPAVLTSLKNASGLTGKAIERVEGNDRYETSLAIYDRFFAGLAVGDEPATGQPDAANKSVFIATGTGYPDALSAGSAAGALKAPLLLVNGQKDQNLPATVQQRLVDAKISDIYLVGGTASINKTLETKLAATSFNTLRLEGANRYLTNAKVNAKVSEKLKDTAVTDMWVVAGTGFADALPGGLLAAKPSARLVLAQTSCLPEAGVTLATGADSTVSTITLLGGGQVMDDNVLRLKKC